METPAVSIEELRPHLTPNELFVRLRGDFPALHQRVHGKRLVYLDSAATTHKPRAVVEAMRHFYFRDNSNVHRGLHELSARATAAFEDARARVARFINAPAAENIVWTRGTTEAINLVVNAWGAKNIRAGDTILLTEMEHHSNIVSWQLLAERAGAKIKYAPVTGDDGLLVLDAVKNALARGPKLFAFTHVSNTLGTINPARALCSLARNHGVTTLVDAAQSAGHLPIDVQKMDCDFLAFSGHKMCGPTGIGALFGRAEILDAMPPWQGGGDMIARVSFDKTTFKTPPHRFEAGTPNIAGAIGLAAAIDYLEKIGRARIFEHDEKLALYALERLGELPGVRTFGPRDFRGALVSFVMESAHPHDLTTFADQHGLALRGGHHCNQPLMKKLRVPGTTRASFYFYNTRDEVDRMIEILAAAQRFFS
jgi:cysteine desulfurase/selenocysteine lyase